jgi:hypothetical protein
VVSEESDLLSDYRRKRARALSHLEALRESVKRFTSIERERVRGEFDAAARRYVFRVPLEPIDSEWTLVLADFVYNTRAALDYLMTALVRSAGNEENVLSEFPIFGIDQRPWQEIDRWWERDPVGTIARKLEGAPAGTKQALKPLQPFYEVPKTNPMQHPLFLLKLMSNRDKHRRLNLLARQAGIAFADERGERIFEGPRSQGRISETTHQDSYLVFLNTQSERERGLYLLPEYVIRIHEPPELTGDLLETLTAINGYIDACVLPTVTQLLAIPSA